MVYLFNLDVEKHDDLVLCAQDKDDIFIYIVFIYFCI